MTMLSWHDDRIGGNSGRIRFEYVLILNQIKYIVIGLSVKLIAFFGRCKFLRKKNFKYFFIEY